MDKDIASGNIGSEGKYDLALTGGNLVAKASAQVSVVGVEASVTIGGKALIEVIKAKVGANSLAGELLTILETAILN